MFSGHVKPIGEIADLNWHRFGLKEADLLIEELEQTSDEERIKSIVSELQHLFIKNAPSIPLFSERTYAAFNSKYFTNFPTEQNPYGPLAPHEQPSFIFTMLNVKKR